MWVEVEDQTNKNEPTVLCPQIGRSTYQGVSRTFQFDFIMKIIYWYINSVIIMSAISGIFFSYSAKLCVSLNVIVVHSNFISMFYEWKRAQIHGIEILTLTLILMSTFPRNTVEPRPSMWGRIRTQKKSLSLPENLLSRSWRKWLVYLPPHNFSSIIQNFTFEIELNFHFFIGFIHFPDDLHQLPIKLCIINWLVFRKFWMFPRNSETLPSTSEIEPPLFSLNVRALSVWASQIVRHLYLGKLSVWYHKTSPACRSTFTIFNLFSRDESQMSEVVIFSLCTSRQ